jgi:hypothetical protein
MIAWNPLGFHILDTLSNGRTFDAECYRKNILTAQVPLHLEVGEPELVTHADNAKAQTAPNSIPFCPENGLRPAMHRPYSPDLVLSDFVLFGHIRYVRGPPLNPLLY